MRGFDQRATLFTLNGVPVYEPYNGIINVDLFPLEMLGGIEIARGASSSLYGPNGMAGQIKLSTFAPRAPLGAAVSTIWRDADLWDVHASASATRAGLSGFAVGRYLTSPNFTLAGGFFYTDYDSHEQLYEGPDFANRLLTTKIDSSEIGAIGRVGIDIGSRDSLAVGAQVRGDSADVSNTVRGTLNKPDFTIASVAAENVYAATDRISLVLGLSYDLLSSGGSTSWKLNPQGVVSVDFDRWGATRIAVARKIRFPTLRELFDPDQGNPDLAPERTLTYEIGHRVARAWGYGALNLFRSDVNDLIASGGDMGEFLNLQSATLQGVEVAWGLMPVAPVRLDLNYTYLDTSADDEAPLGGSTSSAIQHRPAHRFNGILQVFLPWQLLFRTEGLYTSEQLDQFGSEVFVDGFALWNVQVTRPVGDWLSLFAGADNLLDTDYEQKLGSPEPGRRVFAGVRASY